MSNLSGYFFLRFVKTSETELSVTRARIGQQLGSGAYVVRFPGPEGRTSHLALMTEAEFLGSEYLLFETEEQLQAFMTSRASQEPKVPAPTQELLKVAQSNEA